MAKERGENNNMKSAEIFCQEGESLKRRGMRKGRGGKAEKRVFYPEECMVDLLRHTPGINLFEPNKREQLNSP